MPRPTPDGREWLTPTAIADRIVERLGSVPGRGPQALRDSIAEAYRDTGYEYEFKIVRLVERLKDALAAGAYGDLGTPEEPTPLGLVAADLKAIYSTAVLDAVDENGNPLDG